MLDGNEKLEDTTFLRHYRRGRVMDDDKHDVTVMSQCFSALPSDEQLECFRWLVLVKHHGSRRETSCVQLL